MLFKTVLNLYFWYFNKYSIGGITLTNSKTVLKINPRFIGLFLMSIYAVVLYFLSNQLLFTDSPLSIIFDNTKPDEVFNLLISLWMIAWLLESLLEVITSIFKIQEGGSSEVDTRRFTYFVGFLLSILITLSGVRTLDIFFTPEDNATSIQIQLFSLMDIILTAGVLAAGSDGIHQITQAFKSLVLFVKESSDNSKKIAASKSETSNVD